MYLPALHDICDGMMNRGAPNTESVIRGLNGG
jgi:hypothetical protein